MCIVLFFFSFSAFHTIFWFLVLGIRTLQLSVLLLSPQVQSFSKGKLHFLKDQIKLIKLDTIAKKLD